MLLLDKQVAILDRFESVFSDLIRTVSSIQFVHGHTSMTLSDDGMHWPELIMTLKGCSYEEALKHKSASDLVKNDPLLTAIHFERRFKALLKFVIQGVS